MDIPPRPKNGISLCAGGGGLDMGLQLAEPGFHTRCYVEWEQYPQQVIIAAQRAGYFAPAPIWDDVTTFDGRPFSRAIDTVLAGYPCQPFSQAGQRKGDKDERHLWPQIARIIREVQPRWVFLENVAGHVSLGAETVLRELRDMGWTPATGLFSSAETGAPHKRLRWFCVAYRESSDGERDRRKSTGRERFANGGEFVGNSKRDNAELRREPGNASKSGYPALCGGAGLFPPGPGDRGGWSAVLAHTPDITPAASPRDLKHTANHYAALVASGCMVASEAQSRLCRMATGLANRSRALRLLGNGVVPLCAAISWRALANAHNLRPLDLGTAETNAENDANRYV